MRIGEESAPRADEFKAQELTNVRTRRADDVILQEDAPPPPPQSNDDGLLSRAQVAWAFATANLDAPELFAAIADSATPRATTFSPQELANLAWAFAKRLGPALGTEPLEGGDARDVRCAAASTDLFDAISRQCVEFFPENEFKPQEIANVCWAMATSAYRAPDAFWDGAANAAVIAMAEARAQPQNMANTVWAFAKDGGGTPAVRKAAFERLAGYSAARIDEFNPQELGNTVWAFATAEHDAPELFAAVAKTAAPRVDRFIAQNLANTAWAFATAEVHAPGLFDAVVDESARRLDQFKPQEVGNVAWAVATASRTRRRALGIDADGVHSEERLRGAWGTPEAPSLQRALFAKASRRDDWADFSDQGLSNVAWAFAASGEADANPRLFAQLAKEVPSRLSRMQPQGISNTAWAFATAEQSYDATPPRKSRSFVPALRRRPRFSAMSRSGARTRPRDRGSTPAGIPISSTRWRRKSAATPDEWRRSTRKS